MSRKVILIVEDVELNRDLLIQLLEEKYELISAENGQDGVSIASERAVDLVLMDLSLPVLDGWEATRQIKALPNGADLPVIALTAHAMPGDEERARAAGCDDFLTKPIDDDLLFTTVARYLESGDA